MIEGTAAIDFDGVLHAYSEGWRDGTIYDDPNPGAIAGLREIMTRYRRTVIYTTRARDREQVRRIRSWLVLNGMHPNEVSRLAVTHEKPPALFYLDDRAVRFTSWSEALVELDRLEASGSWRSP